MIFTQDLDFGTIPALQQLERLGVIQLRVQDSMPEASGLLVMQALAATAEALHEGARVTINATRTGSACFLFHDQAADRPTNRNPPSLTWTSNRTCKRTLRAYPPVLSSRLPRI